MYSRRLPWSLPPSPLARLIEDCRAKGQRLLDLTSSNPTQVGLIYPDALLGTLTDPRGLVYHPEPMGAAMTRAAIAAYYHGRGLAAHPERIVLTASTSEAYAWLFKLLCDPGDAVLVPRPSYPLFDFLAPLEGVTLRPYPLAFDGHWYVPLAELERRIEGARAILVVNPNNPTGSFIHRTEWDALVALAARRGVALVVDEVFSDFSFAPAAGHMASVVGETRALTFSLSGLSKVLGLPQLKLGWIHVDGPPVEVEAALARLELIADTYLSVSTPVALAAPALLDWRERLGGAIAERTTANLGLIRQVVAGSALSLLPVEGGWYATLRLPHIRSDEEWAMALVAQDGVLTQPGYFYDLPIEACLVVSLLTPPAVLEEGLRRLVRRVEAA